MNIVKSLPEYLKAARRRNEFPTFNPKNSASPNFYFKEILPNLKKAKVVGVIIMDGGCLQVVQSFIIVHNMFIITAKEKKMFDKV